VAARIYDPRRAEIYERLGIPTVATVRWTADQMLRKLLPEGIHGEWTDPSGKVELAEVRYHHGWVGRPLSEVEDASGAKVAFLTRLGEGMLGTESTIIRDGDLLHVIALHERLEQVGAALLERPRS
jgi:trk system potassium uptake protein TrkA